VRARVLGVLLLAAVVGVGGGLGVGYLQQPRAASGGTAVPLPASSPSVPVDPPETLAPYAPDTIDWDPLQPGLAYTQFRMGFSQQAWLVPVPKGWQGVTVSSNEPEQPVPRKAWSDYDELRFRPKGEPSIGGYSLRVKTVNEHVTPTTMVADKLSGMREAYEELTVLSQNDESIRFTFRDDSNHLRYNYFRWYAAPGASEATLEMSVAGRQADEAGLEGLFTAFATTLRPAD
jgi:hypothetical protein